MANFTNQGWSRGASGSGKWNSALNISSLEEIHLTQKKLKKLKQQQYLRRDDEEVAALLLLTIMRGN